MYVYVYVYCIVLLHALYIHTYINTLHFHNIMMDMCVVLVLLNIPYAHRYENVSHSFLFNYNANLTKINNIYNYSYLLFTTYYHSPILTTTTQFRCVTIYFHLFSSCLEKSCRDIYLLYASKNFIN